MNLVLWISYRLRVEGRKQTEWGGRVFLGSFALDPYFFVFVNAALVPGLRMQIFPDWFQSKKALPCKPNETLGQPGASLNVSNYIRCLST